MSRRRCEDAVTNLYLYLDDEMTWPHRSVISWHLRRCEGCMSRFRFEEYLRVFIRERVQEEPRQEVLERLRAFLEEHEPGFGQ
ncbi:MAG: zf-HC2 domain-containing protein [Acidimicrobiia bacterium]